MTSKPANEAPPVTYGDLFADRDLMAIYGSYVVSMAGTMLTRVAVTFLIFNLTDSPFMASVTFAISFAPYLGPAQILATIVDRMPYRQVMIGCDLIRMVLIALIAIPGVPIWLTLLLLFASAMLTPAYQSSRSALFQTIMTPDKLPLALTVQLVLGQSAILLGYFLGGILASIDPQLSLILNAIAFGICAAIIRGFVRSGTTVVQTSPREGLFKETAAGIRVVFTNRPLRLSAGILCCVVAMMIVPEGLAAPWAGHLGVGAVGQGIVMAATPVAMATAAMIFNRALRPKIRQKLTIPLLFLAPTALIFAFFDFNIYGVVTIAIIANLAAATVPTFNTGFITAIPDNYRARANAVLMSGMSLVQGGAVVVLGGLANVGVSIPTSVGLWGLVGLALLIPLAHSWSRQMKEDVATKDDSLVTSSTEQEAQT